MTTADQAVTQAAWVELCEATTALGAAAARWELARARYVAASHEQPRSGPAPPEKGAPAAH